MPEAKAQTRNYVPRNVTMLPEDWEATEALAGRLARAGVGDGSRSAAIRHVLHDYLRRERRKSIKSPD